MTVTVDAGGLRVLLEHRHFRYVAGQNCGVLYVFEQVEEHRTGDVFSESIDTHCDVTQGKISTLYVEARFGQYQSPGARRFGFSLNETFFTFRSLLLRFDR